MAQWLGFHTSIIGGMGSVTGLGTKKSHMLRGQKDKTHSPQKKKTTTQKKVDYKIK